jgi:PAS domain S-box-containing protein
MNTDLPAKILIVEDENIVAKDIQNTLQSLGYTVAGNAASGEEAIQKAGETRPDLVLMDIMLKGYQNGVEAAQQILALYNIPIVYLTAYADDKTLQRAKITEPYGYILKPFEERELHIAIEMAIYKHRVTKKLQEREQWLAKILKTINDAVIIIDNRGEVTFMNLVAESLTAWKQKEALGKPLAEIFKIVEAKTRTSTAGLGQHVFREGSIDAYSRLLAKDGREIPIDDSAVPLRDESGNTTGAILVFRDISARQQAQNKLLDRFDQLQALYHMTEAMSRTVNIEEIYEEALHSLQSVLKVDHAAILLFDADGVMRCKAWRGLSPEYRAAVEGHSPWSPEIKNPQPIFIADVERETTLMSWRESILREGIRALGFLPLMGQGLLLGKFMIAYNAPHQLNDEEARLAQTIASHVAFAIERARAIEAVQASEERFRQMAENIREVFWMSDPKQPAMLYVSPAYEEIWGQSCKSLYEQPQSFFDAILPEDRERVRAAQAKQLQGELTHEEYRLRRPNGEIRWIWDHSFPIKDEAGQVYRIAGIAEDITERKRAEEALRKSEEQLRKSQRLEAIGRLAGGIAHDFNNMMTAIIGTAELAMLELHRDHPVRRDLKEIKQTADRAANLTRQLLAFARQQIIARGILNLNDLVINLDKMLRRLIGEDVELVMMPSPDIGFVKVDSGQMEQVIVNLAVNARDAMPAGGSLILQIANVTITQEAAAAHPELPPGEYVTLTMRDTGAGMTEEVKARLFEPFFTTKEIGKGTGLGLATCYGTIKQNGGHIEVESEIGKGSTFRIYLPRLEAVAGAMPEHDQIDAPPQGHETVLLVEDEPSVREIAARMLREQGYDVLVAANGDEALHLARSRPQEPIHLLVTDVVMPRLSGKAVADQLRAVRPNLKVLFISGYSDDTLARHGAAEAELNFLQKPFSPSLLAYKIRDVLDKKENKMMRQ